jgi:hypothetical protein
VVYRDVTRQAKGLYRLKHVGALGSGLTYLSRYNSGWFCHSPLEPLPPSTCAGPASPERPPPGPHINAHLLIMSELWFGPSENSLTKSLGSSEQPPSGSGICRSFHGSIHDQLVSTVGKSSRIYMICKNIKLKNV